jgi:hypothetical protein
MQYTVNVLHNFLIKLHDSHIKKESRYWFAFKTKWILDYLQLKIQ